MILLLPFGVINDNNNNSKLRAVTWGRRRGGG